MRVPTDTPSVICDCCGGSDWEYLFSDRGHDLGRCRSCGLHFIRDLPRPDQRMTELEAAHFGTELPDTPDAVTEAHIRDTAWERNERIRRCELARYVDLARRHSPPGRWLDIGCGAGTLMQVASERGIQIDGLEIDPKRRAIAGQHGTVYDRPLEDLNLPSGSYSTVVMINVFSHLVSPMQTLREIRRILVPGGVAFLHTSEIGPGVQHKHHRTWMLGDHLMFLGERTIEEYASAAGFRLVDYDRIRQPLNDYSRERLSIASPDPLRNAVKAVLRVTPGLLPTLRWIAVTFKEKRNPMWESSLVLASD